MKNILQCISTKLLFATIMLPLAVFSNQGINFSEKETTEELISGKKWSCNMIDAYGESIGIFEFNEVNGNKVKGSLIVPHIPACDSDRLKGKLKKNILKYRAPNGTPCREVNGVLKFSSNEAGIIEASGTYAIGGTHKRGSNTCRLQK